MNGRVMVRPPVLLRPFLVALHLFAAHKYFAMVFVASVVPERDPSRAEVGASGRVGPTRGGRAGPIFGDVTGPRLFETSRRERTPRVLDLKSRRSACRPRPHG